MSVEQDPDQNEALEKLKAALEPKELLWSDAYIKLLSKKKASMAVGCLESNASNYGVKMYARTQVRAYIDYMVSESIGTPSDNIKFLQTIRDTDLKNYMKKVKKVQSRPIKVKLKDLIKGLKYELSIEEEMLLYYTEGKAAITMALQTIASIKRKIARYTVELSKNPKATRIISGPEKLVDDIELDLVALSEDHEYGRIKTFKITKDGLHVELYSAPDAALALARIQGTDRTGTPVTNVNVGATPEQLAKLSVDDLKAMAVIERKMKK